MTLFSLLTPYSQWNNDPTYDGPTYDGPIYEGQAKCFSSQSLLDLPRLPNKYVSNSFRTMLARRQISPFASIINSANKNGCGV